MEYPLHSIKIVDLTQGIAGPSCTMELGDLGADVIKLEPLEGDYSRKLGPPFVAGESALFLSVNRNKKSLALNWQAQKGQEIVKRLAKAADVFLEDMKPGAAESLGLGYEQLSRDNPRLIYCSITPFGSKGPMSQQEGSELVAQGMTGVWRYLGNWGEPPIRIGQDFASTVTGIFTFHAILASLFHRHRTGEGQKVETSFIGSAAALKNIVWAAQSNPPEWSGFHLQAPFWPADHGYKTKDGAAYLRMGGGMTGRSTSRPRGGTLEGWQGFMQEVGLGEYLDDPRFAGGPATTMGNTTNAHELHHIYDEALQKYTTEELAAIVSRYGGEVLPINDYEMLSKHPQTHAMEIIKEMEHPTAGELKYITPPWSFEKADTAPSTPPPLLGQHTTEVLQSLGYSQQEIHVLKQDGVIAL